jgi:hypothetical protein
MFDYYVVAQRVTEAEAATLGLLHGVCMAVVVVDVADSSTVVVFVADAGTDGAAGYYQNGCRDD